MFMVMGFIYLNKFYNNLKSYIKISEKNFIFFLFVSCFSYESNYLKRNGYVYIIIKFSKFE